MIACNECGKVVSKYTYLEVGGSKFSELIR